MQISIFFLHLYSMTALIAHIALPLEDPILKFLLILIIILGVAARKPKKK